MCDSPAFPARPTWHKDMTFEECLDFSDQMDVWKDEVRDWVSVQPLNKRLVFTDGPVRVALVSRCTHDTDMWRVTRFIRAREKGDTQESWIPWGHNEFKTRADAVIDALTGDQFKEYAPQFKSR